MVESTTHFLPEFSWKKRSCLLSSSYGGVWGRRGNAVKTVCCVVVCFCVWYKSLAVVPIESRLLSLSLSPLYLSHLCHSQNKSASSLALQQRYYHETEATNSRNNADYYRDDGVFEVAKKAQK
jgi:hypothetical protein